MITTIHYRVQRSQKSIPSPGNCWWQNHPSLQKFHHHSVSSTTVLCSYVFLQIYSVSLRCPWWSFYFLAVCESMSVIGIAWLLSMHACCHQKSCGVGRSVLLFVDPCFLLGCSGQDCSNGPLVSTNGKSIYNLWGSLSDPCISWWFLHPCLRLEMLVCCPCCHQWGCGLARIVLLFGEPCFLLAWGGQDCSCSPFASMVNLFSIFEVPSVIFVFPGSLWIHVCGWKCLFVVRACCHQ